MVTANYDLNGNIVGYYPDDTIYTTIPTPNIKITEAQHQDSYNNPGKYTVVNGIFTAATVWPPVLTLAQVQVNQLAILSAAAANAYVSGFQSSASGSPLWYDSDTDTQTVINRQYQIALSNPAIYAATAFFTGALIGTTPIRAKTNQTAADNTKTIQYLNASQMVQLGNDLAVAWSTVKAHLWAQQAAVNSATTVAAAQAVNW